MTYVKSVCGRPSDWSAQLLEDDISGTLTWRYRVPTARGGIASILVPNELELTRHVAAIRAKTSMLPRTAQAARTFVSTLQAQAGLQTRHTRRSGWKWSKAGSTAHADVAAFATPGQVLSFGDPVMEWAAGAAVRADCVGASAGDSKVFVRELQRFSRASRYVTFSVLCSLAGPLLAWARLPEALLVNLHGDSSTGKTLAGRVGAASQGHPNAIESWDMKPRGLEEKAAHVTDLLFVVNAAERCPPRDRNTLISRMTHMVPEGASTVRSSSVQDRLPDLSWRVVTISTSNASGRVMAEKAGLLWEPQDAARFIDIPVPQASQGGIFDRLRRSKGNVTAQATVLVEELEDLIAHHHGLLIGPWVNFLAVRDPTELIEHYIQRFVRRIGSPSGVEGRVARKFGLIYAAGKIANEQANLLGWPDRRVFNTVSTLYERSRVARQGSRCPTIVADFARLVANPNLVKRARRGRILRAKQDGDLLAVMCRHNDEDVVGLRLSALDVLLPNGRLVIVDWLRREGVTIGGHGARRTAQIPLKLTVGKKRIEKPRFILLRAKRLKSALLKAVA